MFESFTYGARGAVATALEQAHSLDHEEILAEHLLLAVLADETSISAHVLRDHGVDDDQLLSPLTGLGARDHDALREIGIDLRGVRESAEAAFDLEHSTGLGAGALVSCGLG